MPRRPSPDIAALEERLRESLGTRVDLRRGRQGGKLTVYFFSDEELEAIIERLS
jgi:ParB family chromosome partitioning protein